MWKADKTAEFDKRLRKWPKKHRRELGALIDNLDTVFESFKCGLRAEQVKKLGCVHGTYPLGIISIDQRGGGGGLKESRLYAYPDEDERVLYQLTIGDKDSQQSDVTFCIEWVTSHLQQKAENKEQGK